MRLDAHTVNVALNVTTPTDARESRRKAGVIAALQPTPNAEAAADDAEAFSNMLARAAHKRACHTVGHKRVVQCDACVAKRCEACAPRERGESAPVDKNGERLRCARLASSAVNCKNVRCNACTVGPCGMCATCPDCDADAKGTVARKQRAEALSLVPATYTVETRKGRKVTRPTRDAARAWLETSGETFTRKGDFVPGERTAKDARRERLRAIARAYLATLVR